VNRIINNDIGTTSPHLSCVGAQTGLGGETFATDGAVEWPVFGPLYLSIVIAEMLL